MMNQINKHGFLAGWMVLLMGSTLLGQEAAPSDAVASDDALAGSQGAPPGSRGETSGLQDWVPESGFVTLFNGKDLSGWCFRAKTARKSSKIGAITESFEGKRQTGVDRRYSVEDGRLIIRFPEERDKLRGQLYTVEEFPEDFVLKLEFRASVNADSGIFIRKPQLQCRDYLVAGPYDKLKNYKPQDWNRIEIIVSDGVAHCTCNGEVLEQALEIPETGPIGLEGDRGQMEYRHLQLKKMQ